MTASPYLSEVFRIVEGALRLDGEKVRNYAVLLADKLQAEGDVNSSKRLRKLLEDKNRQLRPTLLDTQSTPVDGETRFPLLFQAKIDDEVLDFIFTENQRKTVADFLSIVRTREELENKGLKIFPSLLLYGPPGCGKNHLASYIAESLQLPLYIARLDGLISSYLGSTAKNIRAVLEFAAKTPCVLFLDEFDAIGKYRDDQQELGELKRVVNSFLQNLDALGKDTILIAATNHAQLLDPAVWRRFHYHLQLDLPNAEQREKLWLAFSQDLDWTRRQTQVLADLSEGYSPAEIELVAGRLRQKLYTQNEQISLREALINLAEYITAVAARQHQIGVLTSSALNNPEELCKQLSRRNSNLYTNAVIAEISGRSAATVNRLLSKITVSEKSAEGDG